MIQKLRRRFVVAAIVSLAIVLLVILGLVNIVSYHKTVADADVLLALLSANQGSFPVHMFPVPGEMELPGELPGEPWGEPWGEPPGEPFFGNMQSFSAETPFETRFFTVVLEADGEAVFTDISNIAAVGGDTAVEFARQAVASGKRSGFIRDYRYLAAEDGDSMRVTFLDCGRGLSGFRTTLLASFGVAAAGLLGVFLLLLLISGRIVKPVAEAYEKQRRFITDAGHEIKTPLTIISADADLLELECGGSEWLEDIRRQSQRLVGLTNELICLSRLDEEKPQIQFVEFPVSDVVEETAQSFQARAVQMGKQLTVRVQELVSLEGSEQQLRQLTSILLDNALKYAPEDTEIVLWLEKESRAVCLSVTNQTAEPISKDTLSHLFDRFYRIDSSRNSSTGGHGLGLSIAQSIVASHRGKLKAESSGSSLTITASFPGGARSV